LKLRFQADADFKCAVVTGIPLRRAGVDIQSANSIIPEGASDAEVLALAAADQRTLLTHDVRTMSHHFYLFIRHQESPDVILVSQDWTIRMIINSVCRIWDTWTAEEMRNQIRWLPR
jgi:predicted nuclease of predicted toxin-antitoxin system